MKRCVGLLGIALIMSLTIGSVTILSGAKSHLLEGGKVHYHSGRFEKADSLFLESINKGMAVTESYMWHGKASTRLENDLEAGRAFLYVATNDLDQKLLKNDEEAYLLAQSSFFIAAQNLMIDGTKPDTAVLFLRNAIKLQPQRSENYVLLGRFYIQKDSLDAALAVAEELREIDSLSPDVDYIKGRVNFAEAENSNGEDTVAYNKAIDNFNLAGQKFSSELAILKNKVAEKLRLDTALIPDLVSSVEELREANPDVTAEEELALLNEKANLNNQHGSYFLQWVNGYQGKMRQIGDVYNYMGQCYFYQSKFASADSVFGISMLYDDELVEVMYYKGVSAYSIDEFDKAIEALKQYIEFIPDFYYAHIYVALSYLKLDPEKHKDEIIDHLEKKAIEIDPDNPDAYRYMGTLYDKLGDTENAVIWVKLFNEKSKQQ